MLLPNSFRPWPLSRSREQFIDRTTPDIFIISVKGRFSYYLRRKELRVTLMVVCLLKLDFYQGREIFN